jgi:anti-anti-sigma factor
MADHLATFDQISDSDQFVLVVTGELDASSASDFADAAYQHVGTPKPYVVELGSATFMDSSGLKVLATLAVARADAGGVLVRNPCEQIRRLLRMAGMSQILTVEPPLDQPHPIAS